MDCRSSVHFCVVHLELQGGVGFRAARVSLTLYLHVLDLRRWCSGVVVWWCGGGVVWWWDGAVVGWCGGVVVQWCSGGVVQWCGGVEV